MPLKNERYTYRVAWSEDDNEYVGLCAESLDVVSRTLQVCFFAAWTSAGTRKTLAVFKHITA